MCPRFAGAGVKCLTFEQIFLAAAGDAPRGACRAEMFRRILAAAAAPRYGLAQRKAERAL
jgi:hypothetical protein